MRKTIRKMEKKVKTMYKKKLRKSTKVSAYVWKKYVRLLMI